MNGQSLILQNCGCCPPTCPNPETHSTIVVTFSGVTFCPCTGGGTSRSGTINGAFILTWDGSQWTTTHANAITRTNWDNPDCTGESDSGLNDLVISASCGSGLWEISMNAAGIVFLGIGRFEDTILNTNGACSSGGSTPGTGGTCTLDF